MKAISLILPFLINKDRQALPTPKLKAQRYQKTPETVRREHESGEGRIVCTMGLLVFF